MKNKTTANNMKTIFFSKNAAAHHLSKKFANRIKIQMQNFNFFFKIKKEI